MKNLQALDPLTVPSSASIEDRNGALADALLGAWKDRHIVRIEWVSSSNAWVAYLAG